MNNNEMIRKINKSEKDIVKVNEQLDKIDKKSLYYITPEMFTINVEGDDTGRIQRAIDYAKGKSLDIKFGCKEYNTSKPLKIYSSTRLIGTQSNMSSGTGTQIINLTSDMVEIIMEDTLDNGLTVNTNIHFDGILWRGSLTQDTKNKFIANTDTVYVNWGDIKNCGFRGFVDVFNDIKFTGFYMHDIVFYDCNTLGKIGGSDNSFYHWMVNSTETNINRKDYLIKLIDFEISTIEDIFITGALDTGNGCKSIMYMERVRGCTFDHLVLDYCDYYGLYTTSCTGNTIKNSFIRGNARASDASHVIHIGFNCNSNKIHNNYFSVVHKGVEKNENAKIYFIDNTSTKNKIYDNKYDIRVGGLTYEAETNAIYIIDEPSENIVVIKDSNYRNILLSQYCQKTVGLVSNFDTYPYTINSKSKLEIPSLINIDLPRGCVYKVVFDNLPDGLSVYDTVYDGSKISIRFKNDSNDNVTLNTKMTYSINYFSLS